MKKSFSFVTFFVFILFLASGCGFPLSPVTPSVSPTLLPSLVIPTPTFQPTQLPTLAPPSWQVYKNETLNFSLEHPTQWILSGNDTKSGFIGKQVFWWVGDYDPLKQHGDMPLIEQISDVSIDGQQAKRVMGQYLGAVGGMGRQQYIRYVIQKGDFFYMFTLFAVDALGVPSDMLNEILPISEGDIALFEQMLATLTFDN